VNAPPGSPAREPLLPFAAFGLCTLVWSSTFLFIRIGNDTVAPVWGATLRLAIASVLLALLARFVKRPWPRGAEFRAALWFGVVDFGISLPLLYWGEKTVPSSIAAMLFGTIPLVTSMFARVFGLERLRPLKLLAGLVGLAGVSVLVSGEAHASTSLPPLLAVFGAAASAALAGVLLKRAPGDHPIATNAIAHGAGAPLCLIASIAIGEDRALPHSVAAWMPIAYLTLVGSIVAFVTFAWLLRRWSVTRISFIAIVIPVTATGLGMIVRHERPAPAALLGAVVVISGVALALASDARDAARAGR
jgi:drug/metabolite transporter (DMT)-like permease